MIDLKIKTLLTVAEEKNFTKAAEKLNLTQPAVSHQINLLEEELNTQIFIRKKGDIVPTQSGEIIINYAKRINAMYNKLKDEITDSNRHINIKLGITHTAESNQITEIIGLYLKENPEVKVTIITDTTKELYKMVNNYELDLAIVDTKYNHENLDFILLDSDYLVCVLNNNNKLAKKDVITIDELQNENLILRLPSSTTRKLFSAALESINESLDNFNICIEVDNIATIKDLIRKDFGVSVLAKSTCMDEVKKHKLTILPIENLSMLRQNYIIYNKDFPYQSAVNRLAKKYVDETNKIVI